MRLKIIRLIAFSWLAVIAAALFYNQILRGQYYYNLSLNNRIRVMPLEGRRGNILDRNGVVLVDNRLSFDIALIPQDIKNSELLFEFLGKVLKEDKKTISQRFFLAKVAPFAPVVVAEDVDIRVAMILQENQFRFPGLYIQESFRRHYPFNEIGSHVLGYVGKINRTEVEQLKDYGYSQQSMIGKDGVEDYYDQYLKGREGGLQIEVDSRGRQVRLLSVREPQDGTDVQLTIDQRVQETAASVLGDRKGTILVMDLNSGEILGMVSSPAYDPNIFTDSRLNKQTRLIFTDPGSPLLNRTIKGLYPPGSVFKIVLTLAGLLNNKLTVNTTYHCPGYYTMGRRFHCSHIHGDQDLLQGIAHSCNVYFFNVGLSLGVDLIHKYAQLLGLGQKTMIDLPFEEKGNIPNRVQRKLQKNTGWHPGDTLNLSIGQGEVLVTPLQLLNMMAIVARNGRFIHPHVIQKIGDQEIISLPELHELEVPQDVLDILQRGLRLVVTDGGGTARLLNMESFNVSGKTGTAQSVPGREEHAWFVGFNTQGKRDVVFCIFLEFGGSSYNAVVLTKELLMGLKEKDII